MMGYASADSAAPSAFRIPGLTMVQSSLVPDDATQSAKQKRGPKSLPPRPKYTRPRPVALLSSRTNPNLSRRTPTRDKSHSSLKTLKEKRPRAESPPKAPSPRSGGVPNPTPQYMAQAHLNPHRLPQPRRILIVMDLNGTLLYRPNKRRPFSFVQRPHAKAFMSYCLDTFYVAIWSSARPENVDKMVAQLLTPEQRERCLLIWGRDTFGLSKTDYVTKVQVYKRLSSVWSQPRVMTSHPSAPLGGRWDQSNTILVDDSQEKARTEPFNLIRIPEFSGLATEIADVLPQVHDYLNLLAHEADISRFARQSPFILDPAYTLPSDSGDAKSETHASLDKRWAGPVGGIKSV
ncbi:hypothetical protein FZEAL_10904 [Fusarium zealandicum]|uniref:Mitochondrial import inner membrane translocase subunit TIM50 n=1 Tax=Fusarium zealandicum TaxID=1053134 RepID=A0A8H4TTW5_9HYPO|nr:hypothetical protein FZEAL_10904 [Fusarium zealandicum]